MFNFISSHLVPYFSFFPFPSGTIFLIFSIPRFGINSATGVVSTTAALNYEERAVYHLSVIASDGGGTLTDPNRATTQVVIQVMDVNDHTPVCFPASATVILVENQVYTNFLSMTVSLQRWDIA